MHKGEYVTVIMPVYNEERTVAGVIRRVLRQRMVDELIVIDDHSSDSGPEKIKREAAKSRKVTVITNRSNMGKGYNIQLGIERARNGLLLIQDSDTEYFPEDYPLLFSALTKDNVVFGSRMMGRSIGHTYMLAKFANHTITFTFNLLFGQKITDLNTCYKLFRKSDLKGRLTQNGFLIEEELAINFAKSGKRIKEVGIRYNGRTFEEGKKIKAIDGINGLLFVIARAISP